MTALATLLDQELAYANEARHAGQVAAALAYWEMADEPLSAEPPPPTSDDPLARVAAALVSDDEHVVKLAYSAREEARVYGDDATYRWCAALEAGLV